MFLQAIILIIQKNIEFVNGILKFNVILMSEKSGGDMDKSVTV